MEIFSAIGVIASIVGLPAAIYFIVKLLHPRKELSWREVKKGITYLISKINEINPNYLITFSGRGDILASLILAELNNKYPMYTCLLKKHHDDDYLAPVDWESFDTEKWQIFVPDEIEKLLENRVLIIDDLTITGDTIGKLKEHLIKKGMKASNINTMTLLANESVRINANIPHIYWKSVKISEYTVPWGKTNVVR